MSPLGIGDVTNASIAFAEAVEVLLSVLALGSRQRLVFGRIAFLAQGALDRHFDVFASHALAVGAVCKAGDNRLSFLDLAANLGFVRVGVLFLLGTITGTTTAAKAVTKTVTVTKSLPESVALALLASATPAVFATHLILGL